MKQQIKINGVSQMIDIKHLVQKELGVDDSGVMQYGDVYKNCLDEIVDDKHVVDTVAEQAESDAQALTDWKTSRAEAVANIKVTTTAGNEFDGDETSQTRMARAISVMGDTDSTIWVLANNIPTMVSKAELIEALKLSGEAQTALWLAP